MEKESILRYKDTATNELVELYPVTRVRLVEGLQESINDLEDQIESATPKDYAEIQEKVNYLDKNAVTSVNGISPVDGNVTFSVDQQQVESAVNNYLTDHPVSGEDFVARENAENALTEAGKKAEAIGTESGSIILYSDAEKTKEIGAINYGENFSRRNLLDNPFFTVNQRGLTDYNPYKLNGGDTCYTLDRWKLVGRDGRIILTDGYVRKDYPCEFMQSLDEDIANGIAGKKVCASYIKYGNKLVSKSFIVPSDDEWEIYDTTTRIGMRKNSTGVWFFIGNSETPTSVGNVIALLCVKLEIGNFSTLLMDAPPKYTDELEKCQHYFVYYEASMTATGFTTASSARTSYYMQIRLPRTMRAKSTDEVSVSMQDWKGRLATGGMSVNTGSNWTAPTRLSCASVSGNTITIMDYVTPKKDDANIMVSYEMRKLAISCEP